MNDLAARVAALRPHGFYVYPHSPGRWAAARLDGERVQCIDYGPTEDSVVVVCEAIAKHRGLDLGDSKEPARIVINMDGGLIQDVSVTRLIPGVELVVIDYDTDGDKSPEVSQVQQGDDGQWLPAYVNRYTFADNTAAVVAMPDIQEAAGGAQ